MNQLWHSNRIVLTAANKITIPEGIFFQKGACFDNWIALITASNTSIIGISESTLDASILNSEVVIKSYDVSSMDIQGGKEELHVTLRNQYLIILSQVFVLHWKNF